MIPVEMVSTNFTYELPGRPGEGDLPCERDEKNRTVTSYWRMEPEDAEIGEYPGYGRIYVQVGDRARLVWLAVVSPDGTEADWDKRPRVAHRMGIHHQLTFMAIDRPTQLWMLEAGGLFGLKVSGLPSPVLSVWVEPVG